MENFAESIETGKFLKRYVVTIVNGLKPSNIATKTLIIYATRVRTTQFA